MSRIGSSSGVRVATQPLSNIYTVLALVALLALVATAVYLGYINQTRYGGTLGFGEPPRNVLQDASRKLDQIESQVEAGKSGGGPRVEAKDSGSTGGGQ